MPDACPWCAGPIFTDGYLEPRDCEQAGCAGAYLWCRDVSCEWRGQCSTLVVAFAGRDDKSPEEVVRCRGECGGTILRREALGWACQACKRLRVDGF